MRFARHDRLVEALALGRSLHDSIAIAYDARNRMQWRSDLTILAGLASDQDAFDALHAEVKDFYTVAAPDPYQWATHCARVAAAIVRVDPKLAVSAAREFHASGGASTHWIASSSMEHARIAARAGDHDAEEEFLAAGVAAAEIDRAFLYAYEEYAAHKLFTKRDYKRAERVYRDAAETARRETADEHGLIRSLELRATVARALRKDLVGARKNLDHDVAIAEAVAAGGTTDIPCSLEQSLELAAAIEMARGKCEDGTHLRELAAHLLARCTIATCAPGEKEFCDSPRHLVWQGTAACKSPFRFTEDR
jgi:hypothetical protein